MRKQGRRWEEAETGRGKEGQRAGGLLGGGASKCSDCCSSLKILLAVFIHDYQSPLHDLLLEKWQ